MSYKLESQAAPKPSETKTLFKKHSTTDQKEEFQKNRVRVNAKCAKPKLGAKFAALMRSVVCGGCQAVMEWRRSSFVLQYGATPTN